MVVAPAVSERLTLMMSVRSSAQSRSRTREFAGRTRLSSLPVARSNTTTSGDPPGSFVQATRCPFGDSRTIDISGSDEKALAGGGAARASAETNRIPAASQAATHVLMVTSLTARKIPFGEALEMDAALNLEKWRHQHQHLVGPARHPCAPQLLPRMPGCLHGPRKHPRKSLCGPAVARHDAAEV